MILITYAAIVISTPANGATTSPLPPPLSGLGDANPDHYYNRVKDIPTHIIEAIQEAIGTRELRMADSGCAWNKTDVVDDPSLPFSRLIWAAELNGCCVIHYETGGVRYGTHYVIAARISGGDKWVVVWAASGSEQARDYAAFMADLKNGKLQADPRMLHHNSPGSR
jgi:hypothetical protein